MSNKLKKFINYLQSFKMTEIEKAVLRSRIEEFIAFNPIRSDVPVPKDPKYFSIFTLRAIVKGMSLALSFLLIIGGGGISYASYDALPGDALYPIKINVTENVEEKLAFGTEAKVQIQTQKVERRLNEAQVLAQKKDLSPEKKQIVKENLEKSVEKVTQTIEDLKNEGNIDEALNATSKITPVLEAHKEALEQKNSELLVEIVDDKLIASVEEAIKKVELTEESVIEKAGENQEKAEQVTEKNQVDVTKRIEEIKKGSVVEESDTTVELSDDPTMQDSTPSLKSQEDVSTFSTMMLAPAVEMKSAVTIKSDADVEAKIKEAEGLLLQASEKSLAGKYKEALMLSQDAKKIAEQIEIYRKIKKLDTATDAEVKKESSSTTPNTSTTIKTETKVNVELTPTTSVGEKNTATTTTPTENKEPTNDELKAQVIKSIEEAKNKLNFNQEAQIHLQ
ncbi:MAG: hypothetical protein QG551_224 [Patescibacteria group bacterium]|jgi:hypothetical protein|nr:hypothetical protein [Patescibacteria group bacterium]